MIDERRALHERRQMFSARIRQDEFVDKVDDEKEYGTENHRGLD
jgi:hypothetical protein